MIVKNNSWESSFYPWRCTQTFFVIFGNLIMESFLLEYFLCRQFFIDLQNVYDWALEKEFFVMFE